MNKNSLSTILPGSRVMVFDPILFKDDVSTPLSVTIKPATVLKRYGEKSKYGGVYPDLVDVRFDHMRFSHLKGEERFISRGHFTDGVEIIKAKK